MAVHTRGRACCALVLSVITASTTQAAERYWRNAAGGVFTDSANWLDALLPSAGDTATFSLDAGYTVTLSSPVVLSQLFVDRDALTLDLGASTFTTTATNVFTQPAVVIGQTAANSAILTLRGGALYARGIRIGDFGAGFLLLDNATAHFETSVYLGYQSGGSGVLALAGTASSFSAQSFFVGRGGGGTLSLTSGAALNIPLAGSYTASYIANATGSLGAVLVSGEGSAWNGPQHYLTVGEAGLGLLNVAGLGSMSLQVLRIGGSSTGTAFVTVTGASASNRTRLTTASDVYLGIAGRGTLILTSGALLSAGGNVHAGFASGGSGVLTLGGSAFGQPAELRVGGTLNVANNGGAGLMNLNANALVDVAGVTNVGGYGSGTLLLGGATLNTHGLLVWSGGIFSHASGLLIIDHGLYQPAPGNLAVVGNSGGQVSHLRLTHGATLTQNGALYIGGSSAAQGPGNGIVSIESGAQANFTGITRVWPGGTINIAGGILKASSITLNGVFLFTSGTLHLTAHSPNITPAGLFGNHLLLANDTASRNAVILAATTTLHPGSSITLNGGTFSTGKIVNNGGILIFNTGTFALTNDHYTVGAGSLLGSNTNLTVGQKFTVSGTVTIAPGSSLTINGGFFSAGALVNRGTFAFNSGTIGSETDFVIQNGQLLGPSVTLTPSANLYAGQAIIVGRNSPGTLILSGGSAQSSFGAVAQLPGSSGTVSMSGTGSMWNVVSTFSLGGTASATGGAATLTLASGSALLAGSTVTLSPTSYTLVDNSSLGGSTILSRGKLDLAGDSIITGTLVNSGTLTKTGTGLTTISGTLSNSAVVKVLGGTLSMGRGAGTVTGSYFVDTGATLEFNETGSFIFETSNLPAGASVTGPGTLLFSRGEHLFNGPVNVGAVIAVATHTAFKVNSTIGHLTLLPGGADTLPDVYTTQVLTLGDVDFQGGALGGAGTINITGALNLSGPLNKIFGYATLNAGGTTVWSDRSSVVTYGPAVFNNLAGATFEARHVAAPYGFGFGAPFNNYGHFIKSIDNSFVQMGPFNNYGTVTLQNGGLVLGGGTFTGVINADPGTTLTIGGGTGAFTFTDTARIDSLGSVKLDGFPVNFAGYLSVAGTTTLARTTFLPGAQIVSLGTQLVSNASTTFNTGLPHTLPPTILRGRLEGSDPLTINGDFAWAPDSTSSTIGVFLRLNGNSVFTENPKQPAYKTLSGTLVNAGHILWSDGTIIQTGSFTNLAGGVLEITGQRGWELDSANPDPLPTFTNAGHILKSAGNTTGISPAFTHSGTVTVQSGALYLGRNSTSTGLFFVGENATVGFIYGTHTLESSTAISGAGSLYFGGEQSTIRGSINVATGTRIDAPFGLTQTTVEPGATITSLGRFLYVEYGATLTLNSGHPIALHDAEIQGKVHGSDPLTIDGLLSGQGAITNPVANNGWVAPGDSPGTLTLFGGYTQSGTGSLQIEIASLTHYDRLDVHGPAALAGTLDISQLEGFAPPIGSSFTILTCSSRSGEFDAIVGRQFSSTRQYDLVYSDTGLRLVVTAAVPEPLSLWMLLPAALLLATRRRRHAPSHIHGMPIDGQGKCPGRHPRPP